MIEVSTSVRSRESDGAVRRGRANGAYVCLVRFISSIIGILLFDIRVFGGGRVPRKGAAVLAGNHQSFIDPWLLGFTVPRRSFFLARDSLFVGLLGRFIAGLNALPIPREGASSRKAIELGRAVTRAGEMVTLFPEGTRSRDGRLGPLKRGFELIARATRAAVVPALIDGAFDVWPRDGGLTFRPVRIFFGRPLPPVLDGDRRRTGPPSAPDGSPGDAVRGPGGGDDGNDGMFADLTARLAASYRSLGARARRVRWAGAAGPGGRLHYFG
jgi:1-acyl-sn-glycerol-3-phosphate acyltransferase